MVQKRAKARFSISPSDTELVAVSVPAGWERCSSRAQGGARVERQWDMGRWLRNPSNWVEAKCKTERWEDQDRWSVDTMWHQTSWNVSLASSLQRQMPEPSNKSWSQRQLRACLNGQCQMQTSCEKGYCISTLLAFAWGACGCHGWRDPTSVLLLEG